MDYYSSTGPYRIGYIKNQVIKILKTLDYKLINRTIAIVGMGATGLSVARFLSSMCISFQIIDSRETPPNFDLILKEFPDAPLFLGEFSMEIFKKFDLVILSPGVSLNQPVLCDLKSHGVEVIGDLELFLSVAKAPIAAITGSNGKSTVTTMVGMMAQSSGLDVAVGGNLGTPMLDLLSDDRDLYVLELSSFQLELIEDMKGAIVCLLNVSADHMDRYDNLKEYAAAKHRIFNGASVAIFNREDHQTTPSAAVGVKSFNFALDTSDKAQCGINFSDQGKFLSFDANPLVEISSIATQGKHNHMNALAALAIGSVIGIKPEFIISTLKSFKGLPHRCEAVTTLNDVLFINDSKGTNVGATLAAIEGFGTLGRKNLLLLAGGQAKGQNFDQLKQAVEKFVKCGVFFGQDADQIENVLGSKTKVYRADSVASAVSIAKREATAGDIVLFSPACASFDSFSGFEERGRSYQKAVFSDGSLGAYCAS